MIALLLLQAIAGPPVPPELRKPVLAQPCVTHEEDGEIVVCGRTLDARLRPLPAAPAAKDPAERMTFRIPGGSANVHAIQSTLPGATGQGAVVTLTFPFGRK